jgi:hypothetical protein
MGFNFGAFIGGMSQGAAKGMRENEERQFRFDMLAEEEATKLRLQRSAERRAENKLSEENVNMLKSLGFTDAQSSWILKGGSSTVALYSDFATQALSKGIDPSTILDSSLIHSDQQDPRNESALLTVNREVDESADIYELQTGVLGEILGEGKKKPKEYATLQAGHSAAVSRLIDAKTKYGKGSKEYLAEESVLNDWKQRIKDAAAETKNQTEWFSIESRGRIVKDALSEARQDLDFTVDMDGNITSKLEGRGGPAAVAKLNAAAEISARATVEDGVVDQILFDKAERLKDAAYTTLTSFGRTVVSEQEDKTLKKFGYFKTQKNADGTMSPTDVVTEVQKGLAGEYRVGDVILVKEKVEGIDTIRIKVFTGILGRAIKLENGKVIYDMFHDAGEYTERN